MASAPTPAHAAHHLHTTAGTSRSTLETTTQRCTCRGPAAVAARGCIAFTGGLQSDVVAEVGDESERRKRPYWLLAVGVALLLAVAISVCRSTSDDERQSRNEVVGNVDRGANTQARQALEQQGGDPSAELAYRRYFYFANEDDARSLAAELEAFETTVQAPGDGIDEWAVLAEQTIALDESALNDLTQLLDEVARRLHGEYDGWDVATQI